MTRTDNKKPSQSSPIRKGKISPEEIKKTAEELTKNQLIIKSYSPKNHNKLDLSKLVTGGPEIVEVVKAPAPVKEKGDYKAFAISIKAKLADQGTVELTGDFIKSLFPQNKSVYDVVRNLKRSHGLSYRRVENGRNDTYIFFIEPTREELIIQLADAQKSIDIWQTNSDKFENEIIELKSYNKEQKEAIEDLMKSNTSLGKYKTELSIKNYELIGENTKLKSDAMAFSYKALTLGLLLGGLLVYLYLHINGL